ncbi:MAG: hypothetical protein JXB33_04405 [Clostridia bacterium]|nr:hypothetical protein [Clostridia bacterium]
MEIFDLARLEAEGYQNRSVNVFYQNDLFKTRVIVLEAGGEIPECLMDSYVMFYVVKGEVTIVRNGESSVLGEDRMLITEPARLSMKTDKGARILGIQVKAKEQEGL